MSRLHTANGIRLTGQARPLVVIADDDPQIRRLVELTLKKVGCDVATADDGNQALELIRSLQPRLAILDVSMPYRSGFEVGKALESENLHIPIIFLSSHAQEDDVLEGFLSGAIDYVFKPFSPKELQARVQAVLART